MNQTDHLLLILKQKHAVLIPLRLQRKTLINIHITKHLQKTVVTIITTALKHQNLSLRKSQTTIHIITKAATIPILHTTRPNHIHPHILHHHLQVNLTAHITTTTIIKINIPLHQVSIAAQRRTKLFK